MNTEGISVKMWQTFQERLILTPDISKSLDKIYQALDDIYQQEIDEEKRRKYERKYYKNNFERYTKKVKSTHTALRLIDDTELIKGICKDKIRNYEEPDKFYDILQQINGTKKVPEWETFDKTIPDILDEQGVQYKRRRCCCMFCDSDNPLTLSFNDEVFNCFKCGAKGNARQLHKFFNHL